MKRTLNVVVALTMVLVLLTYSSCKKKHDNPVPITDTQIDALSKTWKVSAVTRDGVDQTSSYTNFTLAFSGTHGAKTVNYTASGRPALSPWPAAGTFTFSATTPQTTLARNDGPTSADDVSFTYSVSSGQLQLQFTYAGAGFAARTTEVKGAWVFTMVPN